MPVRLLTLEAIDFQTPQHWHWRLSAANGVFLADHEVKLDGADWRYGAFLNLDGYLRLHTPADRWAEEGARLLAQLGEWIGREVLGCVASQIVAGGTPVTVRVVVPIEPKLALGLFFLPLELGHANGRPLALQDVSLVFESANAPAAFSNTTPVGTALRMLAVFSLPSDTRALNVRQERYALKRFIRELAGQSGLAIDLRVLQYGVTRAALENLLSEDEGWDVLHFSGHGLAAKLLLEREDGSRDEVTTQEFIELLRPARGRLKWVTLSACQSAATTVRETLRWLGIQLAEPQRDATNSTPASEKELPALARTLADELDCAVLAMRYPVEDGFAIELGQRVYQNVFDKGQPLTRALQRALAQSAKGSSPLAIATPALFGRRTVELRLTPPEDPDPMKIGPRGLAAFGDEPNLLVGRVSVLTRASAVLAGGSRQSGVLFHGMAGAGKTTCALELAYGHEAVDRFQGFVWYQAPPENHDIGGALAAFARAWETQLSDENLSPEFPLLQMVEAESAKFEAYLMRLKQFLNRKSVLVVLDNVESLLRSDGQWRDPRWEKFIGTLLGHNGLSRTILTSRRVPANCPALALPIHALTRDEAVLLARQLPNLNALLNGANATDDAQRAQHRQLVAQTLRVVQGHPKLLELAEAQATDAPTLQAHVERAEAAWASGEASLDAFFHEGESKLSDNDFLGALAGWTRSVADTLPSASQTLFRFLCCLEDDDRRSWIAETVWPNLCKRLSLSGDAPDISTNLEPLIAAGLVEVKAMRSEDEEREVTKKQRYNIHPGVSETERKAAAQNDAAFQPAVDEELGELWNACFKQGIEQENAGWVILAGLHAAPYLIRRQRWGKVIFLLSRVTQRDQSHATLANVLPMLRRIATATVGTERELNSAAGVAQVLWLLGRRVEAETNLRDVLRRAEEKEDFRLASDVAGDLINVLMETGHVQSGLVLAEQKKEFTRRAGLDLWAQMVDECLRLQLLNTLGRYEDVLAEVDKLRAQMQTLPDSGGRKETVASWSVREAILDAGQGAALFLKQWEKALELNSETIQSLKARQVPLLQIARFRFNDYAALLHLNRLGEARELLMICREIFEAEGDTQELGSVFFALAELEGQARHYQQAVSFAQTALRYRYADGMPNQCAMSHSNLANYLMALDEQGAGTALAHRVATLVIFFQTSSAEVASHVQNLRAVFAHFPQLEALLPSNFAALCQVVEQVEGVRFAELFETLPKDRAATGDEALAQVLALACEGENPKPAPETAIEQFIQQLVAGLQKSAANGEDVEPLLQELREQLVEDNPEGEATADEFVAQVRARIEAGH